MTSNQWLRTMAMASAPSASSENLTTAAGQFLLQEPSDRFLVINDQDGIFFFVHHCSMPGRETRNAEPLPTALVTLISPR